MSKIKEYYHDQICRGLYPEHFEEEHLDLDFDKWKGQQTSLEFPEPETEMVKKAEESEAYSKWIDEKAEEAEFTRIFEATNTYPF
jgi:hypothetical protein